MIKNKAFINSPIIEQSIKKVTTQVRHLERRVGSQAVQDDVQSFYTSNLSKCMIFHKLASALSTFNIGIADWALAQPTFTPILNVEEALVAKNKND